MTKRSKRFLSYMLAIWLMSNLSYDDKPKPHIEIVRNGIHYANYSNGRVLIGSEEDIKDLHDIREGDVLIIDARRGEDPDMKILDSYKIIENNLQEEIILIMQEYEKEDPTDWYRTNKSMDEEWDGHNRAYYLGIEANRTGSVNLNNGDEGKGTLRLIKELVKMKETR